METHATVPVPEWMDRRRSYATHHPRRCLRAGRSPLIAPLQLYRVDESIRLMRTSRCHHSGSLRCLVVVALLAAAGLAAATPIQQLKQATSVSSSRVDHNADSSIFESMYESHHESSLSSASSNYTVLSWNLLACKWLDPSYYNTSYPSTPDTSLSSASRLIAMQGVFTSIAPDLAFFEEVSDEPAFFYFLESQGYAYFFAPHLSELWKDWEVPTQQCWSTVAGNVIAVKSSAFNITSTQIVQLSDDGDRAPVVTVQDLANHRNLTLACVHLATERVDGEKQVDFLVNLLGGAQAAGVILGGDFNGDFTARLPYAHGVSHEPTHPYCDQSPYISLDHIYLSRDLEVTHGEVHASHALTCDDRVRDTMVNMGSDHYPVSVQFRWPASGTSKISQRCTHKVRRHRIRLTEDAAVADEQNDESAPITQSSISDQ
jgi:endonuclease/exonuclease/phosphatase family metal-dependent hydrolase